MCEFYEADIKRPEMASDATLRDYFAAKFMQEFVQIQTGFMTTNHLLKKLMRWQTQCSKLANKHCVFIPTSEYTEQCRS